VPDLHVLEDLGDAERGDSECKRQRVDADMEQRASGNLPVAHHADDAADMVDIASAEVGEHALAHGVELAPEALGLGGQQGLAGVRDHRCLSGLGTWHA